MSRRNGERWRGSRGGRPQGLSEPGARQWWDFLGIPRNERFELFNQISANCVFATGICGLVLGYLWFGALAAPILGMSALMAAGYFVTKSRWSR